MKTKDELGPCWVENQSSVTNDGKDIIEEIIDFRAAPEKVRDFFSHVTAKLALRRDIWDKMIYSERHTRSEAENIENKFAA